MLKLAVLVVEKVKALISLPRRPPSVPKPAVSVFTGQKKSDNGATGRRGHNKVVQSPLHCMP